MSAALMEQRPQALARAVEGDAESFSRLIEPLLDPAYRLAAVMLADRSAAEDAVQEASIKAWRKLKQLRGDATSLRPWFLSIVLPLDEVAKALGVSASAAKSRIYRAAKRLRGDLTMEEVF